MVSIVNPTDVIQNQEDIAVSVTIRNQGQAAAQVNNVLLDFRNGNTYYNREILTPDLPLQLAGGADTTINFAVDVLSNALLGPDSLRGRVQYFEYNRGISLSDTSAYLSSWNVQGTGGISVLSVASAFDSVSTGQDSILTTVRILNSGNSAVIVDSLKLMMTRGLYIDSTLIIEPGTVLSAASQNTYDFYVALDPASPNGIETINAAVFGRDSVTTGGVSDLAADTTATWLIQRRVNIIASNISPTQVSVGQSIQPQLDIRNTGQANLVVDTSQTRIQSNGFNLGLNDILTIEGNGNYSVTFNNDVISGLPGNYPYILNLVGTENGATFNQSIELSDSLLVQGAAAITIDSVVASTNTVSQDMDTTVTVYISNTGQADAIIDSIIVNPYGEPVAISPTLPNVLAGGASVGYQTTVRIPAAATTGNIILTARTEGRDANTGLLIADNSQSVSDSWNVLGQPVISILSVTSDSSVVLGQNSILVNVQVNNTGQTPVEITNFNLNTVLGLYSHLPPALPVTLGAGASVILVDTVTVATNSAIGSDTLTASITYRNSISGASTNLTGAANWVWTINSRSEVEIVSVNAANNFVSRGQTAIPVEVRIRNNGSVASTLNDLDLNFSSGAGNYTLTGPVPAVGGSIAAGATQAYTFTADILALAQLGPDTLDAQAVVTENSTGRIDTLFNTINPDEWTIQERPLVTIDSVQIIPDVAGIGQQGLRARVYVRNEAAAYPCHRTN